MPILTHQVSTSLLPLLPMVIAHIAVTVYLSGAAVYPDITAFDGRHPYETGLNACDTEADPEAFVEAIKEIVFSSARRQDSIPPGERTNRLVLVSSAR